MALPLLGVQPATGFSRLYCALRKCYAVRTSPFHLTGPRPHQTVLRSSLHSPSVVLLEQKVVPGVNDCPNNCLCSNNIEGDYRNVRLLSQFVSTQTGMILPRTITKVCPPKQRQIAKSIRRARVLGFMPYTEKMLEYLNDPKLF